MVGRPPTSQEKIDVVEEIFAETPSRKAIDVFNKLMQQEGRGFLSKRMVEQIVRKAKDRGAGQYEPSVWRPWTDTTETAEDVAFLMEMDRIAMSVWNRHLLDHEAYWGRRLRIVLSELESADQFFFVYLYGQREKIARNLKSNHADTADLDGVVTFSPWRQGWGDLAWLHYLKAIDDGLVPAPRYVSKVFEENSTVVVGELHGAESFRHMITSRTWMRLPIEPEKLHEFRRAQMDSLVPSLQVDDESDA